MFVVIDQVWSVLSVHVPQLMWRSEYSVVELGLFCYVDSRDQTQVLGLLCRLDAPKWRHFKSYKSDEISTQVINVYPYLLLLHPAKHEDRDKLRKLMSKNLGNSPLIHTVKNKPQKYVCLEEMGDGWKPFSTEIRVSVNQHQCEPELISHLF